MSIRYTDGWKYRLEEAFSIMLPPQLMPGRDVELGEWLSCSATGRLTLSPGYCWDGPSGPACDTPNFMTPSLVHDALYQMIGSGLLSEDVRPHADELLWKMCRERGMNSLRAWLVRRAVKDFGPRHGSAPKRVMEAP